MHALRLGLLLTLSSPLWADRVELLDGTLHVDVVVVALDDTTLTCRRVDRPEELLPLRREDLREVVLQPARPLHPDRAEVRIWTTTGSILEGRLAEAPAGSLGLESALLAAPLVLPFRQLQALRFLPAVRDPDGAGFEEARLEPRHLEDLLFLRGDGARVRIQGILEAVTPDAVAVSWEGATRQVPRDRVLGVVLSPGGEQLPLPRQPVQVDLQGETTLLGSVGGYDGEHVSLVLPGGTLLRARAAGVQRLTFLTDRLRYLSELEPAAFRERPFFERAWGLRVDRNVHGGPLRLGRVTYPRGLGVHSSCTLEYELAGEFTHLVAVVGIDDSAPAAGSVTFRVLLDGQEAGAWPMTRGDRPRRILVPLGQASRLTLDVDTGVDGLDVGDLADWADAKLIRQEER